MDWIGALYNRFQDHLVRDDEDVDAFISSYLLKMSGSDLHRLIQSMNEEEMMKMVQLYFRNQLNQKFTDKEYY
ncbi:DUF6154 family protein [Bacillus songklensis]|uniref:DUF6154 family protein n=1 Tax=Bacillus songklensis TaxID=1069116 RepID=A0ABV8B5V0_9BACI